MALMWKNQTQSAYISPWDPATAEDLAKELSDLKENTIRRDGSISMNARLNMGYNAVCFMGDDVGSVTCAVTRGAMVEHVRNAVENKVDSSTLQEQTASLRAAMMEATDNVSENTKRMLHLRRDIEGIFSPLLIERTADLTGNYWGSDILLEESRPPNSQLVSYAVLVKCWETRAPERVVWLDAKQVPGVFTFLKTRSEDSIPWMHITRSLNSLTVGPFTIGETWIYKALYLVKPSE